MPPIFSREIQRPLISPACLKFQTRTSPCEAACPAGNLIQKVQGLVKENKVEEALEFLRARNPFPGTTGRICTHPCETDCNRREWDEPINIRGLERAVADRADRTRVKKPARMERSGRKIAVIGGGPAGLTAGYFSSLLGAPLQLVMVFFIPGRIFKVLLIEADVGVAAVGLTLVYCALRTPRSCVVAIATGTPTLSSSTRSGIDWS